MMIPFIVLRADMAWHNQWEAENVEFRFSQTLLHKYGRTGQETMEKIQKGLTIKMDSYPIDIPDKR